MGRNKKDDSWPSDTCGAKSSQFYVYSAFGILFQSSFTQKISLGDVCMPNINKLHHIYMFI